jgi:hypothetical protein
MAPDIPEIFTRMKNTINYKDLLHAIQNIESRNQ